jgi:hypothetical protein
MVVSKMRELENLVQGAIAGDHFFFLCKGLSSFVSLLEGTDGHIDTGHSVQIDQPPGKTPREIDGKDEGELVSIYI